MNDIITTSDYTIFHKMKGNRDVEPKRVRMLVNSIKKIGWISNPIIVNRKMEIIDGQGRFEALKELGLPIEYHIVENAGLDSCRVMNANMKAWGTNDYVMSYAESGNENYKKASYLMAYFKVPLETVLMAKGMDISGRNFEKMRNGDLVFTEVEYIQACKALNIYKKYKPIFDRFGGQKRTKTKVIFHLIDYGEQHPDFDHDKMIEALQNCDPQAVFTANFERLLESVQTAYNYKRKKNRLYIYEEYRLDKKIS